MWNSKVLQSLSDRRENEVTSTGITGGSFHHPTVFDAKEISPLP
jgi:hypothetical protein